MEKIKDVIPNNYIDDIFGEDNLELIQQKIQDNLPAMYGCKTYANKLKRDEEKDIYAKFYSSLKGEQIELFHKFINLSGEDRRHENGLAYYLGLKSGLKLQELK